MTECQECYYVLSATNQYILADQVKKFINDGWKLAGGVAVDAKGMFYQAVYTEH